MKTVLWKIRDLIPADYNPRQIKEVDFSHLVKSISEFGIVEPAVVNINESRRGIIIGGHMRIRAAESIGMKEFPCVELNLDLAAERELNIRLNANGGQWDFDKIANEFDLAELDGWGFDTDKIPDLDPEMNESRGTGGDEEEEEEEEEENTFTDSGIIFETDNEFDIPVLDINMQIEKLVSPICAWGQQARHSTDHKGTMLFYVDDYKFSGVLNDPRPIVNSKISGITEPNLSTWWDTPMATALYCVYMKRWFARYCQSKGIRVAVDLNVMPRYRWINLLGVPKGWRAYSTRALNDEMGLQFLQEDYDLAVEHAGTTDILFLVVGSGGKAEEMCKEKGWRFIHQWSEKENS